MKKHIKKTNENCDKKVFKDLENLVANFSNCLFKVHKSKTTQEAIHIQSREYIKIHEHSDLTLRPILAGLHCPTRRLSNLVDILSNPFLIHIKSYIKDNLDFPAKCSRDNKWDIILTTLEVVELY